MSSEVVAGLESMMGILRDRILQPYSLLFDIYGTYNFGSTSDDRVWGNILSQFMWNIYDVCDYLTSQYILIHVRPSEEWITDVEPLCRSAKNSSDFALDEYDDLQESLTGDIFPVRGYFGRIVRGPSISGHIIATLSQLAADMEQLCAMQVGSGSTQAERNDRFRNVTQWYLKVGEVFTEDDETEYGVLTRSFMIMRERLDVIADGAMRSVDIVQESLLPWAVARNETLASILRLMSGRSKWSRDPGTIEDLKWLVTYGAKAAAGIKRTLPMAAAVQRAAVEARDALEEMWQAARSVLLFLETAREEGWMEEKEVCGRVMRRTLVVDPGGVSSAAYRLEAEFIDRVNYMMMEQRKRERIDAFDPRVGG